MRWASEWCIVKYYDEPRFTTDQKYMIVRMYMINLEHTLLAKVKILGSESKVFEGARTPFEFIRST